ncbi:MAG: redoxin domain-containing protein [Planctomycetes bacterium]|nr:redoxin domain-containing protein [Planctomycetota bacterium]
MRPLALLLLLASAAVAEDKDRRNPGPPPPGPAVGRLAPDFEIARLDDPEKTVRLSDFRGRKPVVLVFGSYT